jgi:group I intron endonuclease
MKEKICGLYKIICSSNNKFYLGSSVNIKLRWYYHLKSLRANKHHCIHLQRAYNLYGEPNFRLEIFKVCENILEEEQRFFDEHFDKEIMFNLSRAATGGDLMYNHPNKKEIIERMTATIHKNMKALGEEGRKKIYGQVGAKNGMYGKHQSREAKEIIRLANLGHHHNLGIKQSEEHRRKTSEFAKTRVGDKNSFYGRHHTKETKAIIGKKNAGKTPANIKYFKIEGKPYRGLGEVNRSLNIPYTTVLWRVRSKNFPSYEEITKEQYELLRGSL